MVAVYASTRGFCDDANDFTLSRADAGPSSVVGRTDVDCTVVYTSTEQEMVSTEFVVGFEHPRGTTFYSDEVFWRIMCLRAWTRTSGS